MRSLIPKLIRPDVLGHEPIGTVRCFIANDRFPISD
jgi:hypothetical protein